MHGGSILDSGVTFNITTLPGVMAAHRWNLGARNSAGNPAAFGENIYTWLDQSGNNRTLNSSVTKPIYRDGCIDIKNNSFFSFSPYFTPGTTMTCIMCQTYPMQVATSDWCYHNSLNFNAYVASIFYSYGAFAQGKSIYLSDATARTYQNPVAADVFYTTSVIYTPTAGASKMFTDGILKYSFTLNQYNWGYYYMQAVGMNLNDGAHGGRNTLKGHIICNQALNDTDRAAAEAWLRG